MVNFCECTSYGENCFTRRKMTESAQKNLFVLPSGWLKSIGQKRSIVISDRYLMAYVKSKERLKT
jgi:hypothetical protein